MNLSSKGKQIAGRRVLITGASGFVGSRLAERLVLGERDRVTGLVHRFSGPGVARLARIPIDLIMGDILDIEALSSAAEGCDVIVHLAYGVRGTPEERKEVTISGTENVLEEALKRGIRKIIYLSSAAVHGVKSNRTLVDESAPLEKGGNVYTWSKIQAEKLVWQYQRKYGLPVVVFRPPLIYGPYGVDWTVRIVQEIQAGAILVDGGSGTANLIYVDNLIDAILLAMEKDSANGETFIVVDDEYLTWKDVYEAYGRALDDHPPMKDMSVGEIEARRRKSSGRRWLVAPFLLVPGMVRTALRSREFRQEMMQIPWLEFLKRQVPRPILDRMKGPADGEEGIARTDGANRPLTQLPARHLVQLYAARARFSNEKIKRILGYKQRIPFHEAMELTGHWLRYQKLIPDSQDEQQLPFSGG